MADFNWTGAFAGLLGEGGRLAMNQAAYLQELDDRKYQENAALRREEALAKRKMALEVLGYTQAGAPVTRGEYDEAAKKPLLYGSPLEREQPKGEEPHKFGSDWGKLYTDFKAAGYSDEEAKKRADAATAEKPEKGEKPKDVKEERKKLLKEIKDVEEDINKLEMGSVDLESIKKDNPTLYQIMAMQGMGKTPNEDARKAAVAAARAYKAELEAQLKALSGGGILQQLPAKPIQEPALQSGHLGSNGRQPLSSFLR